jgi:hypothetical protein
MKRLICFLIAAILLASVPTSTLAITNEEPSKTEVKTENNDQTALNLEEAFEYIEKNNIEIKLLDEKIKITERQYKESLDMANYLKGKDFSGEETTDAVKHEKDQKLTHKRKLYDLNNLKHDREEKLKDLKADIEKQFTSVSLQQENTLSIQSEINNLDKKMEEEKLKVKLGTITDINLKNLQSQRTQISNQLNLSKRQLNEALLTLKKNLGLELSKEISLAPLKMELKKFDERNIEERLTKAIESSYEYKKQQEDVELTKVEHNIIKDNTDLDGNKQDLYSIEVTLKNKEIGLEDVKPTLEFTLWSTYFSLKNLEDEIEIQKLNLESAEITLNTTAAKVKVGMDTALNELNARLSVAKQKNAVQKAVNDYMLAAKSFERQLEK